MAHPSYAVTLRIQSPFDAQAIPKATRVISDNGAMVTGVDMVKSDDDSLIFDVTCLTVDLNHAKTLRMKLQNDAAVIVHGIHDATVQVHLGGKIEMALKRPLKTRQDLSKIYTPGVASICQRIVEEPTEARRLTIKRNTVAVVSDGTAVLGLGDIGPEAAMPVMEGKAALFKNFADVDAFPICLDTKDTEEIISIVKAIAPGFGGVNLEDISAPRCFEIERRLKEELDIPVFHDDQHGTAVVVLAALINALKFVDKKIEDVKIVVSGVGAAGNAIIRLLIDQGATDIIGAGRKGTLGSFRREADPDRDWLAQNTNPRKIDGTLQEALKDADVFIGVSAGDILTERDIATMADDAVVFALANPTPEVDPVAASKHAAIVATGRSDYPNQINNVLAFPGLFRGMLDVQAKQVTDKMLVVAANAIANVVEPDQLNASFIIPGVFQKGLAEKVAAGIREEFSATKM